MSDPAESNGLSDEFADYDGDLTPFHGVAWSRLLNPPTSRGLAALVGGLAFLFSNRSTNALALILAIVLVVWAASEFSGPAREGRFQRLITALVLAGIGVALLAWPDATVLITSRLLGGAIIFLGAREVYGALRPRNGGEVHVWGTIRGLFELAVGISMWVAPATMLGLVIGIFAGFWIITGTATVVGNFTGMAEESVDVTNVWFRISRWLEQLPHTADDRSQLYEKILYEGALAARRLSRFFLLMGFATTIAASASLRIQRPLSSEPCS